MAVSAAACVFGVFGVLATVAIITTIVIIRKSKQQKIAYKPNNSVCHDGVNYHYDPETKTIVQSGAPVSNNPNNNLRKRSPSTVSTTDSKSEKSDDEKSEKSSNKKSNSKVAKEVQTDPIGLNQNVDHNKILPDKVLMPMSAEEKVINYLSGDILASTSETPGNPDTVNNLDTLSNTSSSNWSNLSSEKSTDNSEKAYKKRVRKSVQKYVSDIFQKSCELHVARSDDSSASESDTVPGSDTVSESDNASVSSSWSDISSVKSTDGFEKAYKKMVRKTLKELVNDMHRTPRAPSECSDESEFSIITEEPEKCFTCEKNRVNTHMQPCMHRYLCSDCAPRVFRVHKKCKICRAKLERIVVEE